MECKLRCFDAMSQPRIGAIHVRVEGFTVMSQSTDSVALQTSAGFALPVLQARPRRSRCSASVRSDYLMLQRIELDVSKVSVLII